MKTVISAFFVFGIILASTQMGYSGTTSGTTGVANSSGTKPGNPSTGGELPPYTKPGTPGTTPIKCPAIAKLCPGGALAQFTGNGCETKCPSVAPPVACPRIAKLCSDGSVAQYTGNGCKTKCPGYGAGLACPKIAKICPDGSLAKRTGNGCETTCSGNRPGIACPQIARICKDGSTAKYLNPNRSCATFCREDFQGTPRLNRETRNPSIPKSREAR
jgi:hypothetical protein